MILASHFEDTKKSIVNVSAQIIDVVSNRQISNFGLVISTIETELSVSYERVILAINFLYILGRIRYDKKQDALRLLSEA